MLVAEVDGELRAAVPLLGGAAIADPFHRTSELVTILEARAQQLADAAAPHTVRRGRRIAAQDVATLAAAPGGREVLRDDYDLDDAQIDDAVRWWDTVRAFER